MPFAFYDFETTGAVPAFDQPLQFAAILTDDDFNEIDRVNLRCRLAPHILPSPMAMAITGVTPDMMTDPALPSWFAFAQMLGEQIDRWSPACWTGYNSISFDEEVLRQTFYQNLQPELYATQFSGNQRLDIMRAVIAVRVLAPDILSWPELDGRISYKLDQLVPANGFTDHHAHDALGDVFATIHLARLIRDRAPEIWAQLLANRDKNDVMARLSSGAPLRLIENHFSRLAARAGCYCGAQENYANRVAFFDLEAGDPADLVDADDDAILAALTGSPRVIRTVAINKDPSLFELPDPEPEISRRAAIIASRPDFQQRVGAVMARRYEDREEPEDVEQRIYSGFYSSADKALLERFQYANTQERGAIVGDLSDERLRRLGQRVLLSEARDLFSEDHVERAARAIADRWKAEPVRGGWNTTEQVNRDLKEVAEKGLASPRELEDMRVFLSDRIALAERGIMPDCPGASST